MKLSMRLNDRTFLTQKFNTLFLLIGDNNDSQHNDTTPQPFYDPFSGTTRVSRCQKRTSGLYGAREDNRGRHTDHPAGRHSIRTNQCPPLPSPIFFTGRMPFLPPNQQHQSTEGN